MEQEGYIEPLWVTLILAIQQPPIGDYDDSDSILSLMQVGHQNLSSYHLGFDYS
jgi:hypothetical protein